MHAIHISDDNTLIWQAHRRSELQPGQVRVRIAATAVNRADLIQRQGLYPPPPGYSDILGLECSGVVTELGQEVQTLVPGQEVCALLAAGGYASEVVCDAGQVIPIPEGVSLEQAAALPEVFATAWINLFELAGLQPPERVLIKAGGGGVGTAAIQLCNAFGNSTYVVVGDDEKLNRCIELGADGGINRHKNTLQDLTPHGPFDIVLDPVAGDSLDDTLKLMNTDGRLVIIGLMGGASSQLDIGRVLVKRLEILGSTLRSQPVSVKQQVMQALYENVWPKIASGEIRPIIDTVMPITQADQAHQLMASNKTFGKIILTVDDIKNGK
jgi:putative PIG3 family NAD(P)H quinone oxidoreductase